MGLAGGIQVFALGFFAVVAQTLLLRRYLSAFEADELGLACFFGAWLLWIAAGAWLWRRSARLQERLVRAFGFAPLLYVPAFLLQDHLIASARSLAGVAAYELFPLGPLLGLSLLANAAVSLLTGIWFPLACAWVQRRSAGPGAVTRVYLLESLGGLAGGVLVTLLLHAQVRPETVLLAACVPLTLPPLLLDRRAGEGWRRLLAWAPLAGWLCVAGLRGDDAWARRSEVAAWTRLLPAASYQGRFATAQTGYLYGAYQGQFVVVSGGAVVDALPDTEAASRVVALTLAQQPAARRILVVGPGGLSVCRRFLALPTVERVVWMHPDPEYPGGLLDALPMSARRSDPRLEVPRGDVRDLLRVDGPGFDLVVLQLPDPTTLFLSRYSTREFLQGVRSRLGADGVVALRITGGANYLGEELAHLGATAWTTVRAVFAHVVLVPGDESWLLAGDGTGLSDDPGVLQARFTGIPGAARIYPPEGVRDLYARDRSAFQLDAYRQAAARAPQGWLLNTDAQPKALLYALLLSLRRQGQGVFGGLSRWAAGGAWVLAAVVLWPALLRAVYRLRSPPPPELPAGGLPGTPGDVDVLVFTTGLLGMAQSLLLLFRFQARYGSLFLYAGAIAALFLAGCALGSLGLQAGLRQRSGEPRRVVLALLGLHLGLLGLVLRLPDGAPMAVFAALFLLAGAVTGAYYPVAAARLHRGGWSAGTAGARLQGLDHLGGFVGAVVTGLVMLPLLGMASTVALLALVLLSNLVFLVPAGRWLRARPDDAFDRAQRRVGYALFGLAAVALTAALVLAAVDGDQRQQRLRAAADSMAPGLPLELREAPLPEGDTLPVYHAAATAAVPETFVFPSAPLAPGISGYGGPIELALRVDAGGWLLDLRVLHADETPAYLRFLGPWLGGLPGRDLGMAAPFAGIDAVSGATKTSAAVLRTLETAGAAFAVQVLGRAPAPAAIGARANVPFPGVPDRDVLVLLSLLLAALVLRQAPHRRRKRILGLVALAGTGLWLNLQYSSQQVFALLGGRVPTEAVTGAAFLALGVPLVVLLAGNVYCGYLCPFGALQELIADLRPRRWCADPGREVWRYGRAVKYALLFLLAVLFACTGDPAVLAADPLITLFGQARTPAVAAFGVAVLVASVCYTRFWCRNLCPAGAFLALLNGAQLLRRFLPAVRPRRCDLGVRARHELDCLCCDRCRHAPQ